MATSSIASPAPIAVIGIGCRLPGGIRSPDQLEEMLAEGRSGWMEVPADRWNRDAFYSPHQEAKEALVSRSGYFLDEDVSKFDARFFQIPPLEANAMDPQQRMILATTYEAFENAGIPLHKVRGSNTSVFVSIFARDYDRMGYKDIPQMSKSHLTGTGDAILSNRISYAFDLKGVSFTLDTGCSGSLVALHQACQSLRLGESTMAVVGGAQLLLHPDQSINMSAVGMVNPDGRCYVFDSRGSGYARGEGVATVVLKLLEHAIADNDPIQGVIVNSGANQDGKTAGISVPNGKSQASLMKSVYAAAGLDPAETEYVEAHGTGTQVGDKEEVDSIYEVFCPQGKRSRDLFIGSVKANIGHLEASSGIAGLIKSLMVLKRGRIPPHLDLEVPKSTLHLAQRNIKIARKLTPLFMDGNPRRVSVNSFGYGGTNVHVILEAFPVTVRARQNAAMSNGETCDRTSTDSDDGIIYTTVMPARTGTKDVGQQQPNGVADGSTSYIDGVYENQNEPQDVTAHLYMLSAASERSLATMIKNLQERASSHQSSASDLMDLAYTLACRRSLLPWRQAIVACGERDLEDKLRQMDAKPVRAATLTPVCFVFTGQGAQWASMSYELLRYSECFKHSMLKSDRVLVGLGCSWSLIDEISKDEGSSKLGEAEIAQPATTALQIALVDLLQSVGVVPKTVIGHSSGEIAAAYAAGALSHEAALTIAYQRGTCSALAKRMNATSGSMLAVGLGKVEVSSYLTDVTSGLATVACVNSPKSTTISGDEAAIDELKCKLDATGIFARKLKVDTAYHSHHMQKIASRYLELLADIKPNSFEGEEVAFFSTVTGQQKVDNFGPEYWTQNLISQVQFSKGLGMVRDHMTKNFTGSEPAYTFVEIGPHPALAGPAKQTLSQESTGLGFRYSYLSVLLRKTNAVVTALSLFGRLAERGYPIDLDKVVRMGDPTYEPRVVTNLKPYPWDESSFWHESRVSKAHRFRQFPYHDLCGLFDPLSSVHEPRWRHWLNIDVVPWITDHVVDGCIVFPGTGYICMVIEAMRQLVQMRSTPGAIKDFRLRSVSFTRTISFAPDEEDASIELQLVMTPSQISDGSTWEYFRILSCGQDGIWHENCTGQIGVDMKATKDDEVEGAREEEFAVSEQLERLCQTQREATEQLDSETFYRDLEATGNHYGPNFALLDSVYIGGNKAITNLVVPDYSEKLPGHHMQPHLIHPTTLDAVLQLGPTLFKRHCSTAPVVLGESGDLSISASVSLSPGSELLVAASIDAQDARSSSSNVCVFQQNSDGELLPVLSATSTLRAYGQARQENSRKPYSVKMAYKMSWHIDVDHLTNSRFLKILADTDPSELERNGIVTAGKSDEETDVFVHCIEKASSILLNRARLQVEASKLALPHLAKLFAWMEKYCSSNESQRYTSNLTTEEEDQSIAAAEGSGYEGQMLSRIGQNMPDILTGKTDALSLMLEENLLYKLYANGLVHANYAQMVGYLSLLTFKYPHMRFLEIGAGTGGATLPLLRSLTHCDGVRLDRYDYSDISAGFFEQARNTFKQWLDYISFRVLDIERDPVEQGFEEASYDIIVAVNVLHATKNMDLTMQNTRKLLKPGGKLLLIELTRLMATSNLIFGTLPGWWTFEDGRSNCPLLSPGEWDDLLRRTSFSGLDIISQDTRTASARSSMMVSHALATDHEDAVRPALSFSLINAWRSSITEELVADLSTALITSGHSCLINKLGGSAINENAIYIVLDTAEHSLLLTQSADVFHDLKSLFTAGVNILWISIQESGSKTAASFKAMIQGTARVLRRENAGTCKFITLSVADVVSAPDIFPDLVRRVVQITNTSFGMESASDESCENEYTYSQGEVLIPRVETDIKFLNWVDGVAGSTPSLEEVTYHNESRPLKLEVETPGLLGSLRFVDDHSLASPIRPGEIQITARAHGVNFKDVFVALGQMRTGVDMVGEVAGIVTEVGEEMKSQYQIGDSVAGFGSNPFASSPRINGNHARLLPSWMPFVVGATIPAIYATAYYCVFEVARLQKGQSILIHAASGGVGQAAIQLCQHIGAEIFATVGSANKRKLVVERYGIPDTHVFSTRGVSFKTGVLRLTGGRGVDVVLNSLSGDMLAEGVHCVAKLGTFIEIGKTDIYKSNHLNMGAFDRSISFVAVDLVLLGEECPEKLHGILGAVIELFEQGALYALTPINVLPIGKIEEGFRMIAARKHLGKVVLEADDKGVVKATIPKAPVLQLSKNGTYLVAGGLGDLGRRLGIFLSAKGAGHVVLLSRRTLDHEGRQKLEEAVNQGGGTLHIVKCDITKEEDIAHAADYCKSLPPVRGIIHGGMVLKDRPFTHMAYEDFTTPLGPKVYGTINLDREFSSPDLSFFIMLSSVTTVIGNGSQANYATGNAFQDTYAHVHADHPHTKYISINVSGIEGSDSVVNTMQNNKAWLMRNSVALMSFDEFFTSIEYAMSQQARDDSCEQSILGFTRQSIVNADDVVLLTNPLFSLLPYPKQLGALGKSADKFDVEQAIRDARTLKEAEGVIAEAIKAKCAVFLDRPVDEVPASQSLADIGLDSLVSIELKNWMVRTFQITLQTSEIAQSASIFALAASVGSRSKLISDEARKSRGAAGPDEQSLPSTSRTEIPSHGFQCCRAAQELPKYPLPDLDDVLEELLKNFSLFASTREELARLQAAVAEFGAKDSPGRQLYDNLVTLAQDPRVDSWIADLHLRGLYLSRRHPIAPWGNFLNTHHDSEIPHSQSERAAIVSLATLRYMHDLEAGTLEPEWLGLRPLCTYSWKWLFNTVREPRVGCDELQRYETNYYCAVLRRGHLFKVALRGCDNDVSYHTLKATFELILAKVRDDACWAGILTTDDRDSWGFIRERLIYLCPGNADYFRTMEEAAFVVCLDDGSPETREERVKQGYIGDGFNRWHDKSAQFVISANGRSAQIFEHTALDGVTIKRLNERIHQAISSHIPEDIRTDKHLGGPNGHAQASIPFEEYALETNEEIEAHILKLRSRYSSATSAKSYLYHTTRGLGTKLLQGSKVPAKAAADLTIQLASRLYFGYNPGSWEPVSTARFHRGRPDLIQVVTENVVRFCEAACDDSVLMSDKMNMLMRAAKEWDQNVQDASEGKGYLRFFDVLNGMLLANQKRPSLFANETVFKAFPGLILQTINGDEVADSAIALMPADSLWISYCIKDEELSFSVVGSSGKMDQFRKCLDRAAEKISAIARV